MATRTIGVIPAHLESSRLPRKPLLPILGHPMIAWVYARARAARELSELLVATDSDEVLEWCRSLRIPVVLTSPAHRSGTERILEVMARQAKDGEKGDIYVNIQGDEPLVDATHIELLLEPFRESPDIQVSTLKTNLNPADASDPNKVKVVTDSGGHALYFSRSLLPYHRASAPAPKYYKHLGFYAYSVEALEVFGSTPRGQLETSEGLEQLRFLENGIPVTVIETSIDTIGVDTPEDLRSTEEYIRQAGIRFPEF
ncbi:MAG TPA: 3-deoxy-manno-octulosonate cytidylyltransferase [Terriglobia bacterium]|nr:3-deoxy-manno-octulosonate cytidylyltransferase [Terriglobia bacterium]